MALFKRIVEEGEEEEVEADSHVVGTREPRQSWSPASANAFSMPLSNTRPLIVWFDLLPR